MPSNVTAETSADTSRTDASSAWRVTLDVLREYHLLVIILVAQMPMLLLHFGNMWKRPQHQYFPIVVLGIIILLATRLQRLTVEDESRQRKWLSGVLLAVSFPIFTTSVLLIFSPWLAAVSFVLSCGATFLQLYNRYDVENIFGIWLLLWLLVPPPGSYEQQLSNELQRNTTALSGEVLSFLKIPNVVEGATLILPGRHLFVEEACGGIISLTSVLACCMLLAVWTNRAWIHSILLAFSSLALVSLTNTLRIVIAAAGEYWYSLDLLSDQNHQMLGFILFAFGLLLMLSMDRLLNFLLEPIETNATSLGKTKSIWLRTYNWLTTLGIPGHCLAQSETSSPRASRIKGAGIVLSAFCYSFLGLISIYTIATRNTGTSTVSELSFVKTLNADSLPDNVGRWTKVGYTTNRGEYLFPQKSKLWTYQQDDLIVIFALDYTYDHWHRLYDCYESLGWNPSNAPIAVESQTDNIPFLRCEFRKGENTYASLYYSMTENSGESFDPPQSVTGTELVRRRFRKGNESLLQMQAWTTNVGPILGPHRRSVENLFEQLRSTLVLHLKNSRSGHTLDRETK